MGVDSQGSPRTTGDIAPATYEVYDHLGNLVTEPGQYIEEIEDWRRNTRQAVLSSFPETKISDAIDPTEMRQQFTDMGFETSPIAVIPHTEEAFRQLDTVLKSGGQSP